MVQERGQTHQILFVMLDDRHEGADVLLLKVGLVKVRDELAREVKGPLDPKDVALDRLQAAVGQALLKPPAGMMEEVEVRLTDLPVEAVIAQSPL